VGSGGRHVGRKVVSRFGERVPEDCSERRMWSIVLKSKLVRCDTQILGVLLAEALTGSVDITSDEY
jgi:hypothetical protein